MRNAGRIVAMQATGEFPRPCPRSRDQGPGWPGFHSFRRVLLLAVLLAAPCGTSSQQQSPGMGGRFPTTPRDFPQDGNQISPFNDPNNPGEAEKRLRMINAERQKAMVADTDKLLKLARELNEEIARSNSGELSVAELRKVAEIEKLAHNVRDKMVMSVRGPQLNMDNTPPYFPSPVH